MERNKDGTENGNIGIVDFMGLPWDMPRHTVPDSQGQRREVPPIVFHPPAEVRPTKC